MSIYRIGGCVLGKVGGDTHSDYSQLVCGRDFETRLSSVAVVALDHCPYRKLVLHATQRFIESPSGGGIAV